MEIAIRAFHPNKDYFLLKIVSAVLIGTALSTGDVIDVSSDLDSNPGWTQDCDGNYHTFENFTCDGRNVIPKDDYTGNLGFWSKCTDEGLHPCSIVYATSKEELKKLSIVAFYKGKVSIKVEIETVVGFRTSFLSGFGWTTNDLDLSNYTDRIKTVTVSPEYHSLEQVTVIDTITIDDDTTTPTTVLTTEISSSSDPTGTSGTTSFSSPVPTFTSPTSTDPSLPSPTSTDSSLTSPTSTDSSLTSPTSTDSSLTSPTSTDPSLTSPTSTDPALTSPTSTVPSITSSTSTDPSITSHTPTDPSLTSHTPTDPSLTSPTSTDSSITSPTSMDSSTTDRSSTSTSPTATDPSTSYPTSTDPSSTDTLVTDPTSSDSSTFSTASFSPTDITLTTSSPINCTDITSIVTTENPSTFTTTASKTSPTTPTSRPGTATSETPSRSSLFVPFLITITTSLILLVLLQCCITLCKTVDKKNDEEESNTYEEITPYQRLVNDPIEATSMAPSPSSQNVELAAVPSTTKIAYNFGRKPGVQKPTLANDRFVKVLPNQSSQSFPLSPTSPTFLIEPIYSKAVRSGPSSDYAYGSDPSQDYFPRLARADYTYGTSPI